MDLSQGVDEDERKLSETVEQVVSQALINVVNGLKNSCENMGDNVRITPSKDSTQVLVGINPIPEESLARIPASASFAAKHTIAIDSKLAANMEVHRNDATSRLNMLFSKIFSPEGAIGGGRGINPTINIRGMPGSSGGGSGEEALINQMASAVAAKNFDGVSISYIQDLYDKFSEVAQAVSDFPNNNNRFSQGGGASRNSTNRSSGGGAPTATATHLPPEVQHRVMRTLSEVRVQLDQVRNQLIRDKNT